MEEAGAHRPNQSSVNDVYKTALAYTTLGSSAAMLTMVISVKTLTKSVDVARLDIEHGTNAGQGTWKCSLPAPQQMIIHQRKHAYRSSVKKKYPVEQWWCFSQTKRPLQSMLV